jgi:hypothetical protein
MRRTLLRLRIIRRSAVPPRLRRRLEASAEDWIRNTLLAQSNIVGREESAPGPERQPGAVTLDGPGDPAVNEPSDPAALAGVSAP